MIRLFRQYFSPRNIIFIIGEGALVFLAVTLSSFFFLGKSVGIFYTLEIIWPKLLLITIITQFSLYFNDLYELRPTDDAVDIAARLIQSIGITSILLAIIYFLWPELVIGRWIFFISLVLLLLFLVSWRFLYSLAINKKLFVEKVVFLGAGDLAQKIMLELKKRTDIGYDIRSVIVERREESHPGGFADIPIHYGFDNLTDIVDEEETASIIVSLDEKRGVMPYKELLNCKVKGVNIIDGESFYERVTGKVLVEKINPSWLIFSDGFIKSKLTKVMKRLIEFFCSSVLLMLLFPFLLLVSISIKLDSRGPVLFSQERVGEDGFLFTLHKFRSMRTDAEKECGPVWATENDPRVTRVGRIIRKLRIDELPQLWNVFRGDMSFVGPRPERKYFVEKLDKTIPYYNERFSVKPGLTGWAQIKYPYGATEKDALEKLKYDLYYIKNMSFAFDLMVLFHTMKTVLLGKGSR